MENQSKKSSLSKNIIDWTESVVISVLAVILLFTFVFRTVGIEGISMEPTFSEGDRVIIYSLFYKPECGDVVVVSRNSTNLDEYESLDNEPIIKRVVATEGMWVDIRLERVNGENVGVVYTGETEQRLEKLNDSKPYITQQKYEEMTVEFPLQVKTGHVFVLGDNRNHSTDSRYDIMGDDGQINSRYVLGKAVLRIFPFNKFGGVE
ncbi:MAG: signal peptidase I [Acutalibacteraceae bacterium]|nr:signal peptidase I [Acutalibacteraceae bacterium]